MISYLIFSLAMPTLVFLNQFFFSVLGLHMTEGIHTVMQVSFSVIILTLISDGSNQFCQKNTGCTKGFVTLERSSYIEVQKQTYK